MEGNAAILLLKELNMANLPSTISNSTLWKTTLAEFENDEFHVERERLRSSFSIFRERVAQLATEIRKDLPTLTVHDVSHLDALWEVGSLIVGDRCSLTPTEGYVLGGAILLHDLAMSVAATPGGATALKNDPRWSDLVWGWYQEFEGRNPTKDEIENTKPETREYVLFNLLRQKHAENAEKLAFISYKSTSGSDIYLIEDTELRQTFGQIIGKIAHSHWWLIEIVEREFCRVAGSPHWAPMSWVVDPLKIACILRAADAAHIDARRAPSFVKAISNISNGSDIHWVFQEKLNKPYVRDDSLVFTSGQSFSLKQANAWWMCQETLRMIDRELRGIDALLADKQHPRFAATHVAGIESPERLSTYVQTSDWLPINATVHISDLPHIIKSVGGEELYGDRPTVALRELIQNACDAIRARRAFEDREDGFGEVRVSLMEVDGSYTLKVEDDGIGMSRRVLTDFLLDFGRSFWSSPEMQEEFPGLLSSGFKATGKYGIGFFSVFMIADSVSVRTRRHDAAKKDTMILEFGCGLSGRPILRISEPEHQLRDSGTVIVVNLKVNPYDKSGLLHSEGNGDKPTLESLCKELAPALDVRLVVTEDGCRTIAIDANDWTEIDGVLLLERLGNTYSKGNPSEHLKIIRARAAKNLRIIKGENNEIIGRACISIGHANFGSEQVDTSGKITIGGLVSSSLSGIAGVLIGTSRRASRDEADPLVSLTTLANWATEQADLVPNLWVNPELQKACAQNIRLCGGNTKSLPIAKHGEKWLSSDEIKSVANINRIIILDDFTLEYELKNIKDLKLDDNVFVTNHGGIPVIFQGREGAVFGHHNDGDRNIPISLSGAVIEALAVAWGVEVDAVAAVNDFEREQDVRVGQSPQGEIRVDALVIVKPST